MSFLWNCRPLFVKWKSEIDGLEEGKRMIEEGVGGKDMKRHNNSISGNVWAEMNDGEFVGNDLESKEREKGMEFGYKKKRAVGAHKVCV